MSTSVATRRSASGHAARRRSVARRRRRSMLAIGAVLLVAIAVVLSLPLFRKAVNEFNLPLTNADLIRQQAAEKRLDPALF